MNQEEIDTLVKSIINQEQKPEMKRFKMKTLMDGRLMLIQDFNKFEISLSVSRSNDDEFPWLMHFNILFWGFELMWK